MGWGDVVGPLGEACGGQVVEEFVLTSALRREFLRRGWSLSQADMDAERDLLTQNLESMAGPATQGSAVDTIRKARGLGPARYPALLERNAMLRRMVKEEVTIAPEEI